MSKHILTRKDKVARAEGAEGVVEARSAVLYTFGSLTKIGPAVGDAGYAGRCKRHYRHHGRMCDPGDCIIDIVGVFVRMSCPTET